MLEFCLALLTTATVGALLVPLLRTRHRTTTRLDHDLAVYRDQLAEIEREARAGALPETEAKAARSEIERRILAAADKSEAPAGGTDPAWHKYLVPGLSLALPLFALGLYLQNGRPGLSSAPFDLSPAAHRPAPPDDQSLAKAMAALRQRLAQSPDDPELLSEYGEALTIEADGTVSKPAIEAFEKALRLEPGDTRARYYLGLHEAQSGDSRAALARWLDIEANSPETAPWLAMLRAEIARVAKAANLDPQTIRPDRKPPAQGGMAASAPAANGMPQPSREQMDAMAGLTPEQRQKTIRAMVEGLEAKLQDAPGDRAGWLRLANAWRVLGETRSAAAAYAKADALAAIVPPELADWAEAEVRQIAPGAPPSPAAVAVLERLEKAEPRNALALFYLGAASFAAGDKPAAARRWKTLLALLPADAPIRGQLEERVREAEGRQR